MEQEGCVYGARQKRNKEVTELPKSMCIKRIAAEEANHGMALG